MRYWLIEVEWRPSSPRNQEQRAQAVQSTGTYTRKSAHIQPDLQRRSGYKWQSLIRGESGERYPFQKKDYSRLPKTIRAIVVEGAIRTDASTSAYVRGERLSIRQSIYIDYHRTRLSSHRQAENGHWQVIYSGENAKLMRIMYCYKRRIGSKYETERRQM